MDLTGGRYLRPGRGSKLLRGQSVYIEDNTEV